MNLRGSYSDIIKTLEACPKYILENMIIDEHYNSFLSSCADSTDGCEKRVPYIGWFWRKVEFSHPDQIPIGDCGSFIGFMVNNKWDYPERYLTSEEAEQVITLIDQAIEAANQGGMLDKILKSRDNKLQELWDYMQTLTIERAEEDV